MSHEYEVRTLDDLIPWIEANDPATAEWARHNARERHTLTFVEPFGSAAAVLFLLGLFAAAVVYVASSMWDFLRGTR